MPRSSRSSGGRSAPSGSRSVPSGARGSHSMAAPHPHQQQSSYHPNQQAHAPGAAQQQRGSGLFGQMASTAAGVAVGSTVGHGLSNMIFGGGSAAASDVQAPVDNYSGQVQGGAACDIQSKDFLRCLEATGNNMDSCAYYLDQLKACQAAARSY